MRKGLWRASLWAALALAALTGVGRAGDNETVGETLDVCVYPGDAGQYTGREAEWVGSRGQSRRLLGFKIGFRHAPANVGIRYRGHFENVGDTDWVSEGQVLTGGEGRRLEGFSIELTGKDAAKYNVLYQAHLENYGDTPVICNGLFAGTRGEGRRVEAISVIVVPK